MADCQFTYTREMNKFKAVAESMPYVVDAIIEDVLKNQARPVAIQFCPKRTGRLRRSIRVERVRLLLWKLVAGDIEIDGVYVNYAKHVNDGTRNMMGWHYMNIGMEAGKPALIAAFRNYESYMKRRGF